MQAWLKSGGTAIITGGGNGIGRAAGQRFLQAGTRVLIADVDAGALAEASRELDATTGELHFAACIRLLLLFLVVQSTFERVLPHSAISLRSAASATQPRP